MQMKALLYQSPFALQQLSRDDCERFEKLASDILRNVLREYDHFGAPPTRRIFSKRHWKVVKRHEHCTVYSDRSGSSSRIKSSSSSNSDEYDESRTAAAASDSAHSSSHSSSAHDDDTIDASEEGADWKMPELVVSGSVPGTLDDVLYGMTTHDSADMLLRTAYVDDHWLDAAVLHQIQKPTSDDPFRFLGVKWYIKGIPKQYQSLVRPRDFVFLEASGTLVRANDQRIGYFLRHPVDLPGCEELSRHSITRGRFTSYSIYTPLVDTNEVDIFVRGKAEPNGKMTQSMAISLTANSLLSSSNAVVCSQSKKLTWLLRQAKKNPNPVGADGGNQAARQHHCSVCTKKFGKLSSVAKCSVCCASACSRCRVTRSLSYVATTRKREPSGLSVEQMSGTFCKSCVTRANAASALDVARSEVLSGRYGLAAVTPRDAQPHDHTVDQTNENATAVCESADSARDSWVPAIPYNAALDVNQQEEHQCPQHAQQRQLISTGDGDPNQTARQELWRKMAELRLQAESVYQLTKQTSELHVTGSGSSEHFDSDVDGLD